MKKYNKDFFKKLHRCFELWEEMLYLEILKLKEKKKSLEARKIAKRWRRAYRELRKVLKWIYKERKEVKK